MYDTHFLLDKDSAIKYIKDKSNFFDKNEDLTCEEIGDGNINYVFRIKNKTKSIVLKQADILLRSSQRPLDTNRIYIESEILKYQSQYSDCVPKIYFFDDKMHIIAMQDISNYKNMRKELMSAKIFPNFANQITSYLTDVLIPSTDLVMNKEEKKKKVQKFINIDLCNISEDLVFEEPYNNYKHRNVVLDENKEFVQKNIYENPLLHSVVAHMRNNFMNNAQALIHADLHTGSIFINDDGIKIIDPEFAFYGPIGYDLGNVIGNLYFSLYYNELINQDKLSYEYIQRSIYNTIVFSKTKMLEKLKQSVNSSIYNDFFIQKYTNQIISDSLRYAGLEMIRRVVGDAKVAEITSVKDTKLRANLEQKILKRALMLVC